MRDVGAVVLLRPDDGAALLQHRDDKPGIPHPGMWTPPGGHCEPGESIEACAARELLEETGYRCGRLRALNAIEVDFEDFESQRLTVFWDVYDGRQPLTCREGQALEFVTRADASRLDIPHHLMEMWDAALAAWRRERDAERDQREMTR